MKFNGKILSACALLVAVATCNGSQKSYYIDNATNKSDNLGIPIYVGIYKMNKGGFITTPQKDGETVVYDKTFLVNPGEHAKLDAIKLEAGEKQRIVFSASLDKLAKSILSKNAPKQDVFFISPGRMRYYEITGDVYKLKQSTKLLSQKPVGSPSTESYNLTKEFAALAQEKEAQEKAQKEQLKKEQQEKVAQQKLPKENQRLSIQNNSSVSVYVGFYIVGSGKVINQKEEAFKLEPGAHATFAQKKAMLPGISGRVPQFIFSTSLKDLAQYVATGKRTNTVISSPITPDTWYYQITGNSEDIKLEPSNASKQLRLKSTFSYNLKNEYEKAEKESKEQEKERKAAASTAVRGGTTQILEQSASEYLSTAQAVNAEAKRRSERTLGQTFREDVLRQNPKNN